MFEQGKKIAIIGGGIAGMSMALALHSLSIPCEVYEMRPSLKLDKRWLGGGMMLQPNSLRILDKMGVFDRLQKKGYTFDWVYYKNAAEETVDRYPLGDKANYGYDAIRIFRQELLNDLCDACSEREIEINFNKKFTRVVEESDKGVVFEFEDGSTSTAEMLVAADGIHSKIRNYVCPGAKSTYLNLVAITYVTERKNVRIPEDKDYNFPVGVTTTNGIFMLAPQKPDGSEMLAGTQFFMTERTKEEWDDLLNRPEEIKAMLRNKKEVWPDIIQSALDDINEETFNLWPFYLLPRLARWTSATSRRVVLIGDAAHGLPPTTGQGASQAFEDVHSLSLLIAALHKNEKLGWEDALDFWQKIRQERIGDLMELTRLLNNKRLPSDKLALMKREDVWYDESKKNPTQMAWLYLPDIDGKIEKWVEESLEAVAAKEAEAAKVASNEVGEVKENDVASHEGTPLADSAGVGDTLDTLEVAGTSDTTVTPSLEVTETSASVITPAIEEPTATRLAPVEAETAPPSPHAQSFDGFVKTFKKMTAVELSAARATLHMMMAALEVAQMKDAKAVVLPSVPSLEAFNFSDFKKVG